jgi:hypothetical protein
MSPHQGDTILKSTRKISIYLKNTFKIIKVVQINRIDDEDTVSGKTMDFTSETVGKLIHEGYQVTLSK